MNPKDISTKQESEKNESPGKSGENIKLEQEPSEARPKEIGGPKGLEQTRYGDWEKR